MIAIWVFMVISLLIIPISMLCFGSMFVKTAPKEINSFFGYRTNRSMKNRETWEFAHKYCGRIWRTFGRLMIPLSVLFMIPVFGKSDNSVGILSTVILVFDVAFLMVSVAMTESALKRTFDENGNMRLASPTEKA